MLQSCTTYVVAFLLACTCARADDHLLRLETIGFRDSPVQEQQPADKTLESIETVARIGQPFYANCSAGPTRLSIYGVLEQLSDGRFRVQIRYRRSVDSGQSIPGPNGTQIPITKSTNIETTAIVELQKPAELGKDNSIHRDQAGTELRTRTRSLLSLTRFSPASH